VTQRVKDKIQELQSGLPKGVRILPAYDRNPPDYGAIHTLTRAMWEEIIIAALAVFLILLHVRSAFVICITLRCRCSFPSCSCGCCAAWASSTSRPTSCRWPASHFHRHPGGPGIVMTENATHHLKEHFGDRKVTGDTRDLVIPACRTVAGRSSSRC